MGKEKKILAFCTTENLELDLTSCWIDNETETRHEYSKPSIKTIALSKSPDVKIKNKIGDFFRTYNIIAYGFSDESLNIDVVFLLNGYSCLCKADIIANNTKNITLVSKKKPKELMQELADAEITVEAQGQGIYHFQYMFNFQIVVLEALPKKEQSWLKTLTSN